MLATLTAALERAALMTCVRGMQTVRGKAELAGKVQSAALVAVLATCVLQATECAPTSLSHAPLVRIAVVDDANLSKTPMGLCA